MKVWLIRHGMTRLGEEKRYQGRLDDGLSPEGRAALKQADFRPKRVYVSPALRARETAEILFPEAEQLLCPELREMDFGNFEGRGWWEMEEDAEYRDWVDGGCRGRCPGGEEKTELTERVNRGFERILEAEIEKAEPGEELVIVAHGGTQMALLEEKGIPQREYYRWQRPCGCGWLLGWEPEGKTLHVIREISFLK